MTSKAPSDRFWLAIVCFFVNISCFSFVFAAGAPPTGESLDQLYEKAKKEGGRITLYAPLSNKAMEVIPPAFMKKFPGLTVNHIDATPDQLVARVTAEARGGRILADVFGGSLPYMAQIVDQKLLAPLALPEAAAYPGTLKSDLWVATDMQFYIVGWNTNLVKKGDEPNSFEDLANAKWKDTMMAEARDFQMLIGLAKRKYNNDEKAIDLFKRIAANQVEFHKGHSQLVEFLRGGATPRMSHLLFAPFPAAHEKGRADPSHVDRRDR